MAEQQGIITIPDDDSEASAEVESRRPHASNMGRSYAGNQRYFFSKISLAFKYDLLNSIFQIPEFVLKLIHIKRHRRETIYKRPKIVYPTEENY